MSFFLCHSLCSALFSPVSVQWLRICLPMQELQVWSLIQLKFHVTPGQKKRKCKKQKQYCNKFNEDFKNGQHQKIFKKYWHFKACENCIKPYIYHHPNHYRTFVTCKVPPVLSQSILPTQTTNKWSSFWQMNSTQDESLQEKSSVSSSSCYASRVSRFTHAVAWTRWFLSPLQSVDILLYVCLHLLRDICFHLWATLNKAVINIYIQGLCVNI